MANNNKYVLIAISDNKRRTLQNFWRGNGENTSWLGRDKESHVTVIAGQTGFEGEFREAQE